MANNSIGALWKKTGSKGEYFSGKVNINGTDYPITVFANGFKEKDNQPDFKIYPQEKKGGAPTPAPANPLPNMPF